MKNTTEPESNTAGIEADKIAEHLISLSAAVKALNSSKLKRRVILLLLRDMTNVQMSHIETILNALPELTKTYVKQ